METKVLLLSAVANRLIEGLVVPLFKKFELDKFYIMYVSWVLSGLLIGLAQINLFAGIFPDRLVGLVLTAVVCGLGSNVINDILDFVRDVRAMLRRSW